jgi:pilus assembly protein CpaC
MKIGWKRATALFTVISILIFASAALAAPAAVPVHVIVNKGTIITIKEPSKRVSLSNPDIAEMNLISPREILINGKKVGTTTLIVWDTSGKVTFFDVMVMGDFELLEQQIKETAPNDDVKVELANDTIVLSGTAANQGTIKKIIQLAQAYAVSSEVTTTTKYSAGLTTTETSTSGKVLNHIMIKDPQQVILQVKVAQVNKTNLQKLGISWIAKGGSAEGFSNLIGAPVSTNTTTFSGGTTNVSSSSPNPGIAGNAPGLGSFDPLDAFQLGVSYFPAGIGVVINALATKNLAKILAEPNLVVNSGQKGEFLAGSKIPYNVLVSTGGQTTPTITFVDVGIKLNFAPEVLENGVINLKIDPAEVSNIAGTLQVNGYPIIETRQVSTSAQLREGESLVLAGLLRDETIKSLSKIPMLGDIPILGALFRTTNDDIETKELVFFITPKLVKPIPEGTRVELPGEKPLTPEEQKEFEWIPIPKSGQ